MNEKQFLKTASRVRGILESDEFAREDDIYLTWKYWKSIDPLLEELTIKQFKTLFLSGYFGLPASITRARALLQNKTNPELRGIHNQERRSTRGEILRGFFGSEGRVNQAINEDLQVIQDNVQGDEILDKLRDLRTHFAELEEEERRIQVLTRGEVGEISEDPDYPEQIINTKIDDMKKKIDLHAGEKYYTVGEYLSLFRRGQSIDIPTRDLVIKTATRISQANGIPEKLKTGSGVREGLRVLVFRQSILEKAFNEIINPLT